MRVAVIGSGLSSYGSCTVLVKNQIKPDVFDVGVNLDEEQHDIKKQIKETFNNKDTNRLKNILNNILKQSSNEYPKKKYFGSEKIYKYFFKNLKWNNIPHSNSIGGFSKIWSASALFPDKNDLIDWPEYSLPDINTIKKYFPGLPYSSKKDNLDNYFQRLYQTTDKINVNESIEKLEKRLSKINSNVFVSGFSKSFIRTRGQNKCEYCGLCMTGCVYGSILDSTHEFEKLIKEKKISFFNNHELIKIIENQNKTRLIFANGKIYDYDKVFLATGAVSTAKIILNSFQNIKEVKLSHASGFVIPFFSFKPYKFSWPNTNTLSQLFFELKNNKITNWIHCQFSQPNEIVMKKIGFFKFNFSWINKIYFYFFRRLFTINIAYHSKYSGKYKLKINKENSLKIQYVPSLKKKIYIESIYKSLTNRLRKFGLYSFKILINKADNSDNYYVGGSFPMKDKQIKDTDCNSLGQIKNVNNIHIVDPSTFPSIPATTFGLLNILNSAKITENVLKNSSKKIR